MKTQQIFSPTNALFQYKDRSLVWDPEPTYLKPEAVQPKPIDQGNPRISGFWSSGRFGPGPTHCPYQVRAHFEGTLIKCWTHNVAQIDLVNLPVVISPSFTPSPKHFSHVYKQLQYDHEINLPSPTSQTSLASKT